MSRRRGALVVAVALVALGVPACSNGDGERDGTAASPSTTEPPPDPSPGCGGAARGLAAGEEEVTITSGGDERWYLRSVPPAHDGETPVPLVVDFHGYLEGAAVHARQSDLAATGDEEGFLVVTPQGSGDPLRWQLEAGSADHAFVVDVLDEVEGAACIDRARVYATGLSYGAMMTAAVACALPDRIAAIAPVAGVRDPGTCADDVVMPMVTFHGTADGFLAYDGGIGEDAAALPAPDGSGRTVGEIAGGAVSGPAVPEVVRGWAVRNGCDPEPAEERIADDVTLLEHECPDGADTLLYRIEGGGHSWPGSAFSKQIERVVGPTTSSIDANDVMWAFFLAHPKR